MKEIPLTHGKFATVDDDNFVWLSRFNWCLSGDLRFCEGYAASAGVKSLCSSQLMHRVIMNPPKNMEVDHIDGNTLNNCRSNLRIVTHRVNGQNKHKYVRVCPPNPDQRYPEKTAQIAGMDTGGIS